MNLLGLTADLDAIIHDFAFLAMVHKDSHPANTGDVSQVLTPVAAASVLETHGDTASAWYSIERLETLHELRRDGRTGYRAEGVTNPRYFAALSPIAGKLVLITRTGSQIPAVAETIRAKEDGKLFNVLQVDEAARSIRIIYGHHAYGSIPSIETHVHLLANALCLAEGHPEPATVHAHPSALVSLGRHPAVRGSFERFNAAVYTSIEGLNRNYTDLIGVVPYFQSGTRALVDASIEVLARHRLVLWMNHGFVVREANIRRAYTLLAYAEDCARAALFTLAEGAMGLPFDEVRNFLEERGLLSGYREVFGHAVQQADAAGRPSASR